MLNDLLECPSSSISEPYFAPFWGPGSYDLLKAMQIRKGAQMGICLSRTAQWDICVGVASEGRTGLTAFLYTAFLCVKGRTGFCWPWSQGGALPSSLPEQDQPQRKDEETQAQQWKWGSGKKGFESGGGRKERVKNNIRFLHRFYCLLPQEAQEVYVNVLGIVYANAFCIMCLIENEQGGHSGGYCVSRPSL